MKSYLWPGADGSIRQRLQSAGVPFFEWKDGIILEGQAQLEAALKVFGATASEETTEFANLFQLAVRFPDQPQKSNEVNVKQLQARVHSRANYIQVCSVRLAQLLEQARASSNEAIGRLKPLRTQAFAAIRADFVAGLSDNSALVQQFLAEQFAALRTTAGITDVQCLPGKVLVYTDTIYTQESNNGARKELGQYMLSIDLTGNSPCLHFTNATRRVDGFGEAMHAPTVFASGTSCLDEVELVWLELIARFELAAAVELAIQFLQSSGEDPFLGRFTNRWPAVSADQSTI
jgi:hypothetical protein